MATTTAVLSHHATLCPHPLSIHKKSCRATFRQRILRKSTHIRQSNQYTLGPLDDIIDEIKDSIWALPPDYNTEACGFDWANPFKTLSTWAVTPLPVSGVPSDQPLMIRKNKNSYSSASGSSVGNTMASSRNNSQGDPMDSGSVDILPSESATLWPLFEPMAAPQPPPSSTSSDGFSHTELKSAQQALESVIQNDGGRSEAGKRRSSRLRLFTNGFPYLRRAGTGETSSGSGDTSEVSSPIFSSPTIISPVIYETPTNDDGIEAATDNALVEAFTRKHARSGKRLASVTERSARQLLAPIDFHHDQPDYHSGAKSATIPTTLKPAVRIFPQVKLLAQEYEEFNVAVEVEGVLHNRRWLPDTTVDVIFVVDNGYYVTGECLEKAIDAVNGSFNHMNRGDRVALYTTHCTHHAVSGNRPDLHYPLRPFHNDTEEIFRDLTTIIRRHGTQVWYPPRPNPSMTEVVLSVARSLREHDLNNGRTHVVLLSPAAYVLHDVSKLFPDLYIHRVNPAPVPYRRHSEVQETACMECCCESVSVSNCTSYQSVPGRIKRIFKDARCQKPVGAITKISIDLRTRKGCEVLDVVGSKDLPNLRLGQVHTLFCRVRVTRSETLNMDLKSNDPVFNSSLDAKELRKELLNADAKGATKVHLFDVQIYYQNSLHSTDCWNYCETPLVVIRELGDLMPPIDASPEVYKRLYFYHITRMNASAGGLETKKLLALFGEDNEQAKQIAKCIAKETRHHQDTFDYEKNHRQKLPLCPGPVAIEASPHDWLVDLWDRKKPKRKGMVTVKGEEVSGLIDGINGLEHLG